MAICLAMQTERHIAAKCNNRKMLEAMWKPVLNCNSLGTQVCNRKNQTVKISVRIVV